jgi:excisionase family DNA binding protein
MSVWFTRREAADYLRYRPEAIDALARQGKLKRYRLAGRGDPRFLRAELDGLMEESFAPNTKDPQ